MKYITRTTQVSILPEGEPIFSEKATHVKIDDDAAGEYVVVFQCNDDTQKGEIKISPDEWPHICNAITEMFEEVEKHERKLTPDNE